MRFRTFLTSQIPDSYGLLSVDSLILEAVINPGEIKLSSVELSDLNKFFNKLDIYFVKGETLSGKTDGTKIIISVPKDVHATELQAMIGHEIIHREQHKRSSEFENYSKRIVQKINDLATEFNKDTNKEYLRIERDKLLKQFLYGNMYEMMAYAYQLVKDRESYNLNSVQEIMDYFSKFLESTPPKKFRNYVAMYWIIKDKL